MEKLAINGGKPVRKTPIYYGHQFIDEEDINAVVDVLRSDYLTCGPAVVKLEQKICKIIGVKHAVAVSSGTAALHAACYAANIQSGDEVITTPLTFAATVNCILYMNAIPVFADVDPDTYNIDPKSIEEHINEKTKAIIAVDFTGQAVDLEKIGSICKKYNLILIEDGAHSIGTKYKGQFIGNIADLTTFSFHPVKTITGGEGGAILTNDDQFYQRLCLFRSHGITRNIDLMDFNMEDRNIENILGDWYYQQIELGYNYRITDIQASLITSQLDKLMKFKLRRREIEERYNQAFQGFSGIILQKNISESETVKHIFIIQLDIDKLSVGRKEIYDALKAENVYCNVHYIPVYFFPYYQKLGYRRGICPNTEKLYKRIITIPLYPSMSNEDVESVITAVKKVVGFYLK